MKFRSNSNEGDLINMVKSLMKDDQDFVKLYIIEGLVELAKDISPQVSIHNLHPQRPISIYQQESLLGPSLMVGL